MLYTQYLSLTINVSYNKYIYTQHRKVHTQISEITAQIHEYVL